MRVGYGTRPEHIQIDVLHAIPEVSALPNHRAVVAVAPKCSATSLPRVVPLGKLSLESLHHPADTVRRGRLNQEVGMVTRDAVR